MTRFYVIVLAWRAYHDKICFIYDIITAHYPASVRYLAHHCVAILQGTLYLGALLTKRRFCINYRLIEEIPLYTPDDKIFINSVRSKVDHFRHPFFILLIQFIAVVFKHPDYASETKNDFFHYLRVRTIIIKVHEQKKNNKKENVPRQYLRGQKNMTFVTLKL